MRTREEAEALLERFRAKWKPIKFLVHELYLLHRPARKINQHDEISEVRNVIKLGKCSLPPEFGKDSLSSLEQKGSGLGRSLLMQNLALLDLTSTQLFIAFEAADLHPLSAHVLCQKRVEEGKVRRRVGIVEFATHGQCVRVFETLQKQLHLYAGIQRLFREGEEYVRPLWWMAFPDAIGTWSCLKSVTRDSVEQEREAWNVSRARTPKVLARSSVLQLDRAIEMLSLSLPKDFNG